MIEFDSDADRGLRLGPLAFSRFVYYPTWSEEGCSSTAFAARRLCRNGEPRFAGLTQTPLRQSRRAAKAVLEQPSSRRMTGNSFERRNIARAETAS
jgi:hypothetical protein